MSILFRFDFLTSLFLGDILMPEAFRICLTWGFRNPSDLDRVPKTNNEEKDVYAELYDPTKCHEQGC
jgi:hypothetical protein